MKINSEFLYNYINDLATDEKVTFKVYYDDEYITLVHWNGKEFEWGAGTITSEAFFNPLYDFEVIEEDKKIEKLKHINSRDYLENRNEYLSTKDIALDIETLRHWINKIIDYLEENK